MISMTRVRSRAGAQAPEAIPTPVMHQEVVQAILVEANASPYASRTYTAGQARSTLDWIRGFVQRARLDDYWTQYPTPGQMDTVEYEIFDLITPHGMAARPGSAADLVNQLLLDPSRNETSIWHDQEPEGNGAYCTIKVSVGGF